MSWQDFDLDLKFTRRQREYDSQRATVIPSRKKSRGAESKMPSSKGEPTDPELREKIVRTTLHTQNP